MSRRHPGDRCGCGLCAGSRAASLWRTAIAARLWAEGICPLVIFDQQTGHGTLIEARS